jgi:hypothetical protein
MTPPKPVNVAPDEAGFPRILLVIKWTIITSLTLLALLAAAFWTMVLGGFAASGFRAPPAVEVDDNAEITPECAWPLDVNEPDAKAVCRMFYRLTPDQREQVLRRRK